MSTPRPRTWLTPLLVLSWVVLHALALRASGRLSPPGAPWWSFGSPEPRVLVDYGALVPALVELGEWRRLLLHAFLHLSLLHLLLNAWVGLGAGRSLERVFGPSRTWIVFFVSALAGGILHVAQGETAVAVGASGGIFGIVGALGLWAFTSKDPAAKAMRGGVLFFLAITVGISFLPFVGLWGHLGGLAGGVLAMAVLGPRRAEGKPASTVVRMVAALLLLVAVGAGIAQAAGSGAVDREGLAPLMKKLEAAERLGERLYRRPQDATPPERAELGARLDALLEQPPAGDAAMQAAFSAYVEAWRPVAEGNVPDPLRFEAERDAARARWMEWERKLRDAAGLRRGL